MSWKSVRCQRENCDSEFKVDESLEERRCPSCGSKHYAPWDSPDADVINGHGGDRQTTVADGGGNGGQAVSLDTPDGEVHVHIHIHKQ